MITNRQSPVLSLTPHLIGLLRRGKLIFCYYFSCVSCKITNYISRTELCCLANWKGKVITSWIDTASSFVRAENWYNKAKSHTHSDALFLMGDGKIQRDTESIQYHSRPLKVNLVPVPGSIKQGLYEGKCMKTHVYSDHSGFRLQCSQLILIFVLWHRFFSFLHHQYKGVNTFFASAVFHLQWLKVCWDQRWIVSDSLLFTSCSYLDQPTFHVE